MRHAARAPEGQTDGVYRLIRVLVIFVALLALAWPASASTAPSLEQTRQLLQDVAVRIEVESPDHRSVCTGWIGWSDQTRSAVYTAAHCFREGARYHLTLSTGQAFYASGLARWEALDLMALWIPRGGLRALRTWKHIPDGPFRALYILRGTDGLQRLVEAHVPRVYWEIRFENHPAAVALPIHSIPGTSGAPVIDLADGLLIGMVVGYVSDRSDVAAILPAQHIYDALLGSAQSR